MSGIHKIIVSFVVAWLAAAAATVRCDEPYRYADATAAGGRLETVGGLPVLLLQGTPEQIGSQEAALVGDAAQHLIAFPKELLARIGRQDQWPEFVRMGQAMAGQFPKDHLLELDAFAEASGYDRDSLLALNTMIDTYRGSLACSSLMVAPERSSTGGPLFGRNLDFPNLGKLYEYTLVKIYRPDRKHAFASIGFPGMLGCLSGMNDAGLAVAVHEIFTARDGGSMLDRDGVPYSLAFRRVLEECTSVEEARTLIGSMERTTLLSMAMCDRSGGAVLEMTPKTVVLRRDVNGVCACTNHFRSPSLSTISLSRRYRLLMASDRLPLIGLDDVARRLDAVNLGRLTMHSMIFEPEPLVLHLAYGSCPASSLPMKRLELQPLFEPERSIPPIASLRTSP